MNTITYTPIPPTPLRASAPLPLRIPQQPPLPIHAHVDEDLLLIDIRPRRPGHRNVDIPLTVPAPENWYAFVRAAAARYPQVALIGNAERTAEAAVHALRAEGFTHVHTLGECDDAPAALTEEPSARRRTRSRHTQRDARTPLPSAVPVPRPRPQPTALLLGVLVLSCTAIVLDFTAALLPLWGLVTLAVCLGWGTTRRGVTCPKHGPRSGSCLV